MRVNLSRKRKKCTLQGMHFFFFFVRSTWAKKVSENMSDFFGCCSSGESLKEPIDEIGEKELRRAATCFSLTSVNWLIMETESFNSNFCLSFFFCLFLLSNVLLSVESLYFLNKFWISIYHCFLLCLFIFIIYICCLKFGFFLSVTRLLERLQLLQKKCIDCLSSAAVWIAL